MKYALAATSMPSVVIRNRETEMGERRGDAEGGRQIVTRGR